MSGITLMRDKEKTWKNRRFSSSILRRRERTVLRRGDRLTSALQRTRPLLRFLLEPKGLIWAAAAEAEALARQGKECLANVS